MMKTLRLCAAVALVCALAVISTAPDAFAQAATTATDPAGFTTTMAWIITVVALGVGGLAGYVLMLVSKKTGITIDAQMAASIQQATTNAAGLVLNQLGNKLVTTIGASHPAVLQYVPYVDKAVAEAVKYFGLTPADIAQRIVAKLPQVANTATPATPPTAVPAA